MNTKSYGNEVKSFRLRKGLSQSEFGKLFEPSVSSSIVSRWERGVNHPSPLRIIRLLELGVISK